MEPKFKIPTETVDLPSKGKFYPEGHPLKAGTIEMKYMTAKEEDILTNQNYISKGIVIDKLLQSLIVTEFNYDDLLIGDKNAIMVAARILSYGKDYNIKYKGEDITVDLTEIKEKETIIGLKKENFDLIFDPYFTTKHSSKGTGLGLYISKLIIEKNMGGELSVQNDEHGAVFKIVVLG